MPTTPTLSPFLGTQIWLERTDSPARVDRLFATAARVGIAHVRLFLMWPWIEPTPGQWDFSLFDAAFDSAARHGIKIKATLTANSGPWHIGTPMMLHSHSGLLAEAQRAPATEYIRRCAARYAKHAALGQWVLWNEPSEAHSRGDAALAYWRAWLQRRYDNDLARLNTRWLTGFASFADIPFPESIPHPLHIRSHWQSYGPHLDDARCRADWLNAQLHWVKQSVRAEDPHTPTCVNPAGNLGNLAAAGTDLPAMAADVDVLGASFHPAWHFTYAPRLDYPALIATGVRQMVTLPGTHRVEVTEVQTGNTTESSVRPNDASPNEIARFHLAGLAAGAESVTGWCFNVRHQDNEAGDWALLDDADEPSPRSHALRRLADKLAEVTALTGPWRPARSAALVLADTHSQAIEHHAGRDAYMHQPGRRASDGPQAASLLAVALMRAGLPTTVADIAHAPALVPLPDAPHTLLLASHITSWDAAEIAALLPLVHAGATLLLDGISGRRDHDAALHNPWPGGLATPLGLEAAGLQTHVDGYPLLISGLPAGTAPLTRIVLKRLAPDWHPWPETRFSDGEPAVLERPWGKGRVILFRAPLGAALLTSPPSPAVRHVLARCLTSAAAPLTPVAGSAHTIAIPIATPKGQLVAVLAPDPTDRAALPLRLQSPAPAGWTDLWPTAPHHPLTPTLEGELLLPAPDGIALLWNPSSPPFPPAR